MREPILKYYDLGLNVTAFSSTRHGGVSTDSFTSFNINPYCGDNLQNVLQNKESLCRKLGIKPHDLILPHQNHGTTVRLIDRAFLQKSEFERTDLLEDVDALVTSERKVCVGVSTADCVPILLYDEQLGVAAAIHAGWRGTKDRIVEKTLLFIKETFGCSADIIRAAIGPCISRAAFEVDDDVWKAFYNAGFAMEEIADKRKEKWHIDLVQANAGMLLKYGVRDENIIRSGICTFNNNADFFSARKQTIKSGRIFTGIVIR